MGGGVEFTYAYVQLDCSPQNQHGAVAGLCNGDDLDQSHDGADGGEHAQHENGEEADLTPDVDLKF